MQKQQTSNLKHCTAMKIQTSCYLAVLLLLSVGCQTTFHKPGASDADYKRDLEAAKAYAKAEARKAQFSFGGFSIPGIIVAHLIGPPIERAKLRKKLIDESMKTLGWEKQNGKDTKRKSHAASDASPFTHSRQGRRGFYFQEGVALGDSLCRNRDGIRHPGFADYHSRMLALPEGGAMKLNYVLFKFQKDV